MDSESLSIIIALIVIILLIIFLIWLNIILPINMARKRGRNALGWVLVFWLVSPIIGIVLLLALGESNEKIRDEILDELRRNKSTDV